MGAAKSKFASAFKETRAQSKFAQIYKEHSLKGAFYVLLRALERYYVTQTKNQFAIVNDKVIAREHKDRQLINSQRQIYGFETLFEIQQIMNELYKEKKISIQTQFRDEIKKYLPTTKDQPCQRFNGIKQNALKFLYEYDSAPEDTKKQIEEECKRRYGKQYDLLVQTATEQKVRKLKQFLENSKFENNFQNMRSEAKKLQESRQKKRLEKAKQLGIV